MCHIYQGNYPPPAQSAPQTVRLAIWQGADESVLLADAFGVEEFAENFIFVFDVLFQPVF